MHRLIPPQSGKILPALLLACNLLPTPAQVYRALSEITPGTENTQLVYNGDFLLQGSESAGAFPNPTGWSRGGEMLTGPGLHMTPANHGTVALGSMPQAMYQQLITLEPDTAYILSAYLWNFGDAANHATTVVDLNDAPSEAQLILTHQRSNADQGWFAYQAFHTSETGTNVLLRLFFDGISGAGASPAYHPRVAQWDNLALTKASDFSAPAIPSAGGNLRPRISITCPLKNASFHFTDDHQSLPITAAASDGDGILEKIEFYAGTTRVGEATGDLATIDWSGMAPGNYELTAVATDDDGASTLSAPVPITITIALPPTEVRLHVAFSANQLILSWPTNATSLSLLAAPSLDPATPWTLVEQATQIVETSHVVTLPIPETSQFFRLGYEVDAATLHRKHMLGYQGWFAAPDDGSAPDRWVHWFRGQTPTAANATFDLWPELSELEPDELFPTDMTMPDGSPAHLYSAHHQKTVDRHFHWMKDHHLDGVFLQRFTSELRDPAFFSLRNQVLANVRSGAERFGRVWAVMYDISGQPADTLVETLTNDWHFLTANLGITNSPRYLRHEGKPVLAIWGFGFSDRPGTPDQARAVIDHFRAAGVTLIGGVPTYWRTLQHDSKTDPAWAGIYRSFDILSPWSVGRYANLVEAGSFRQNLIAPDLLETAAHGIEYLPVIFPGFSWGNLTGGPYNQIPRQGGAFYWRQAFNAIAAGSTMLYTAMFDEVDEGTAMYKLAPTTTHLPAQGTFVPLDIDGFALPSDWYLQLADHASRMLRGEIPVHPAMPIQPPSNGSPSASGATSL